MCSNYRKFGRPSIIRVFIFLNINLLLISKQFSVNTYFLNIIFITFNFIIMIKKILIQWCIAVFCVCGRVRSHSV